jgi:hypothetical protein
MFGFEDYGFGSFGYGLNLDGRAELGTTTANPSSADIFGNENLIFNLERSRDFSRDIDTSPEDFLNYVNELLQVNDVFVPIQDVFSIQALANEVINNPDLVQELAGTTNFIADYLIDAAKTLTPLDNGPRLIEASTNDALTADAYNAYVGGFESVQEYRYLTGVDDFYFGDSLQTQINDDIFSYNTDFQNNYLSFDDNFSYEPNYTFATDSIFGAGGGGGGSSGSTFYDNLPFSSEESSGDVDEQTG